MIRDFSILHSGIRIRLYRVCKRVRTNVRRFAKSRKNRSAAWRTVPPADRATLRCACSRGILVEDPSEAFRLEPIGEFGHDSRSSPRKIFARRRDSAGAKHRANCSSFRAGNRPDTAKRNRAGWKQHSEALVRTCSIKRVSRELRVVTILSLSLSFTRTRTCERSLGRSHHRCRDDRRSSLRLVPRRETDYCSTRDAIASTNEDEDGRRSKTM